MSLSNLQHLEAPDYDPKINYFDEYWKLYLQNEINFSLIKDAESRTEMLHELLAQIEVEYGSFSSCKTSSTISIG